MLHPLRLRHRGGDFYLCGSYLFCATVIRTKIITCYAYNFKTSMQAYIKLPILNSLKIVRLKFLIDELYYQT